MSEGPRATAVRDRPAWQSFSLVGLLCLALAAELACNRLAAQLVAPLSIPLRAGRIIDWVGLFTFHLASLLAVLLMAIAGIRWVLRPVPAFAPRAGEGLLRMVGAVAMMGFVFVTVLGLWQRLPPRLGLYLQGLFVLLVAMQVRDGWPWLSRRARLWLSLLVAAVLVRGGLWEWVRLALGEHAARSRLVISFGEALVAVLAAASPMCLLPRPRSDASPSAGRLAAPLVLGGLAVAAALWLGLANWPLAARIAAFGFGLQLPFPAMGVVLHALALGCWVATVAALLARPGVTRLRGYGLLAIGLTGYQLGLPYQLASMWLGVLCVVESYRRGQQVVLAPEGWHELLRQVAARLGAGEVSTVGAAGYEEARIVGAVGGEGGEAVGVRLLRSDGALLLVELAVGHAPDDEEAAPLTLCRRGTPPLGRHAGQPVRLGDADFDEGFAVYDARRVERDDPLLADDVRAELRQQVAGWLAIWPGRGVRYRSVGAMALRGLTDDATAVSEGGPSFMALLALLVDLKRL